MNAGTLRSIVLACLVLVSTAAAQSVGVATCASSLCHGSATPLDARDVLQNEYVTWSHFDPHGRAYRVLLEPAAKAMARRLGIRAPHEATECLACHTDAVPVERRGPKFQIADGVGCEACHGAAERWLVSHVQAPRVTHADNVANGLVALERAEVRAAVCMNCHVGDSRRLATHRMMAAGHPRLTFELDTYTELWRTAGGREHYRRNADVSAVRTWLTGLGEATVRALELAETRSRTRGLPEFAVYACYSCHRSLSVSDWNERDIDESSGDLPPGALRLPDGSARALIAIGRALDVPAAEPLARSLNDAQRAANDDPAALPDAVRAVDGSTRALVQALVSMPWTPAERKAALNGLADAARRGAFPDYAAAEQAAMGMVLLLAELELDRESRADVDRLFAALENDNAYDRARFGAALERLKVR